MNTLSAMSARRIAESVSAAGLYPVDMRKNDVRIRRPLRNERPDFVEDVPQILLNGDVFDVYKPVICERTVDQKHEKGMKMYGIFVTDPDRERHFDALI